MRRKMPEAMGKHYFFKRPILGNLHIRLYDYTVINKIIVLHFTLIMNVLIWMINHSFHIMNALCFVQTFMVSFLSKLSMHE
jgi:hypothetical protein